MAAAGAQTPSAAILPLRSGEQDTTAILCLIGNYPFTFNAPSFQRFLADAALQIKGALRRQQRPTVKKEGISFDQCRLYRRLLVSGGLVMVYQPIIDLLSGAV